MMNNLCSFKGLEISRYTVTYSGNVTAYQTSRDSTDDIEVEILYSQLISYHKNTFLSDDPESTSRMQVFRNHQSTLVSYLAWTGKTTDSKVGPELKLSFEKRSRDYLVQLQKSPHTISDRRSHLRVWHAALTNLINESRAATEPQVNLNGPRNFHSALRTAFAAHDEAPKTIARKAGASTSAIQRWLKGATPNKRALPTLTRIEHALGLEKDALRNLLSEPITTERIEVQGTIPYRVRLQSLSNDRFALPRKDISPALLQEWRDLFKYKTATRPKFRRSEKGVWRLLPKAKVAKKLHPTACMGELGCIAADIEFDKVRRYLGFLCRPQVIGGFGIPQSEVMTLAWFAVPEAVDAFLEFMKVRAEGIVHRGHLTFSGFVGSLTDQETGYLTQQPCFASRLPTRFVTRPFEEMCEETHTVAREWKRNVSGNSRKPEDPLRTLLASSEPLAPLLHAVQALDAEAASAAPGSLQEAVLKRNALLLALLLANPLRRRNFVLLTYSPDGMGNLYRSDSTWRLRFEASDFKNQKGAASKAYDAPLPESLTERIEEYLDEYRPRLVRRNPNVEWLLPTRNGTMWEDLNREFFGFVRRLVPQTLGFGPHSVRHLIATDYLRKHPNDFPTVAQLLHDKLETVMANYAHLRHDVSFGRWEEHLRSIS